ncbi:DNA-processing protein DprA [Luteimonas sp. JM171]|uniref:DNA-processing protein DprA n=1 Tax=Luteimonas sp. JM171 TaxID=1896164 RepID=UPI000855ED94|nr:DNA-processing protein DprA [Luteimonas sp. JM171]AOH36021.1 DNA protecting protein DprA [Luteimonas sp. JM171]
MTRTCPTNDPRERSALLRLLAAGGRLEPRRRLLEACGSAATALDAGAATWRACGLAPEQAHALESGREDARTLEWLEQPGHHLMGWNDPDYPALLRTAPRPPLALFVAGDPALLWHPAVAVVGSRSPTAGGRDNTAAFARAFARSGLGVTSGLALGVDSAAHRAALEAGGITVAVLGCGIDRPYPARNRALWQEVARSGAVVSEYPPGTVARAGQFPARNRIVAGLSLATLVVEAATRSGALITARLAADAGRDVFAVPGSIHNPMARGCHRLIRSGAGLVESAGEVIDALAPVAAHLGTALRSRLGAPIETLHPASGTSPGIVQLEDPDYQKLWEALGHDPTDMDSLAERTGLTAARLSSMLPAMELEGRVVAEHGRYSRKS